MGRDAPDDLVERLFSSPRGCLAAAAVMMVVLAGVGVGIGLVASGFGVPWGPAVTVGVVVGVLGGAMLALLGALKAGIKEGAKLGAAMAEVRQRVQAMPWEEVRARAEGILESSYSCTPADHGRSGEGLAVGAVLRELFGRFDRIESANGELEIARESVGPSELREGLIRIGWVGEGGEVVVERGKDEVSVVDAESPDEQGIRWPTVLHYVTYLALLDELAMETGTEQGS